MFLDDNPTMTECVACFTEMTLDVRFGTAEDKRLGVKATFTVTDEIPDTYECPTEECSGGVSILEFMQRILGDERRKFEDGAPARLSVRTPSDPISCQGTLKRNDKAWSACGQMIDLTLVGELAAPEMVFDEGYPFGVWDGVMCCRRCLDGRKRWLSRIKVMHDGPAEIKFMCPKCGKGFKTQKGYPSIRQIVQQ